MKDQYNIHSVSPPRCNLMHLSDSLANPVVHCFLEEMQVVGSPSSWLLLTDWTLHQLYTLPLMSCVRLCKWICVLSVCSVFSGVEGLTVILYQG